MDMALTMDPAQATLERKLDLLSEQVAFLAQEAREERRRREEWDELKAELTPIMNNAFRMSVNELAEIGNDFQLEDGLRILKRLLRNMRNVEAAIDQLESFTDLWESVSPLSRDAFLVAVQQLQELEQKGYFTFLQGGMEVLDRIVTAFTEEDIRQLGDNVVLILQTVKEMTQPEIMNLVHNTVEAAKVEEPSDPSLLSIVRQLNDPAVKKGLARTLNVLKTVSDPTK
jgi:uncharacterized protein YjgD (DUF1641 family)